MTAVHEFALRGDHIKLDALLKAAGVVGSGGAAKVLIVEGGVRVNGLIETRRGRKLRPGDRVEVGSEHLSLVASTDAPGTADG
jgi:ribosome-associated protein